MELALLLIALAGVPLSLPGAVLAAVELRSRWKRLRRPRFAGHRG